jgi:hypothetical protein
MAGVRLSLSQVVLRFKLRLGIYTNIQFITANKHGARKEWKSRLHRQHPLRYACALVYDTRRTLTEIQVLARNRSSTHLEESAR